MNNNESVLGIPRKDAGNIAMLAFTPAAMGDIVFSIARWTRAGNQPAMHTGIEVAKDPSLTSASSYNSAETAGLLVGLPVALAIGTFGLYKVLRRLGL